MVHYRHPSLLVLPLLILSLDTLAPAFDLRDYPMAQTPFEAIGPHTERVETDSYAAVLHVSPQTQGTPDGSAEAPYPSIAQALASIKEGRAEHRIAILVSEGEFPTTNLKLKPFVDLYGGFAAGDWNTRDISAHPSILSGGEGGPILIAADPGRLDGFHLTGARHNGVGGAILCRGSSPEISNNFICDNRTLHPERFPKETLHAKAHEGAGMAIHDRSHPLVRNNLFCANTTEVGDGGGVVIRNESNPTLSANLFVNNQTGLTDTTMYDNHIGSRSSNGAAISVTEKSNPEIKGNLFAINQACFINDGGALYIEYGAVPKVMGNWFLGNTTSDDGGAIYVRGLEDNTRSEAGPTIEGNLFAGNRIFNQERQKFGYTEAIFLSKQGLATIRGNLFAFQGTGVGNANSVMTVEENDIAYNSTAGVYVDLRIEGVERSLVRNNRIWGNGEQISFNREVSGHPTVENNRVEGGYPGVGNVDWKPEVKDQSLRARIAARHPNDRLGYTTLQTDPFLDDPHLAGNLARVGEQWTLIKANSAEGLLLWGLVTDSSQEIYIPRLSFD